MESHHFGGKKEEKPVAGGGVCFVNDLQQNLF